MDYNKYPPNWKEIRQEILKRANNKCEFCGLENHSLVYSGKHNNKRMWLRNLYDINKYFDLFSDMKIVKVVLTIAHLDHDEENWNVKNDRLAALCQLCHLKYDKEEHEKRRFINNKTASKRTFRYVEKKKYTGINAPLLRLIDQNINN
jgi:hypothetical protein